MLEIKCKTCGKMKSLHKLTLTENGSVICIMCHTGSEELENNSKELSIAIMKAADKIWYT
ncbi:hypothetical protein DRH13_01780 [Candidatus Woesebacteria bacterium]|nr:MAG: hypothetical protein DRH13_01780 [Candidatus Woesebacteria bacterium]